MNQLNIQRAPVGVSIQDAGRNGYLRYGVSSAGPMDWARHSMANIILGKPAGDAVFEVGPAGIGLKLEGEDMQFSFAGPGFILSIGGQTLQGPARFLLRADQVLDIVPRSGAMWGYLGIQGKFDLSPVLGSYSENSVSGLAAAKVNSQSRFGVYPAPIIEPAIQTYIDPYIALEQKPLEMMPSSQYGQFSSEARASLADKAVTIAPRFDRMAYQLTGIRLHCERGHDILSDGVTMGAIQVPGDGRPFVLMADHQPTGGYPKIACICKADLPRMAQMTPGDMFSLRWVTLEQATKRWLTINEQIKSITALHGI